MPSTAISFGGIGRALRSDLDQGGRSAPRSASGFSGYADVQSLTARLATGCGVPSVLADNDDDPAQSAVSGRPGLPFPLAATSGSISTALTATCCNGWMPSRRAYRWFYGALHTLDFPVLVAHPFLRDGLVVGLCALGLHFLDHRHRHRLAPPGRDALSGQTTAYCSYNKEKLSRPSCIARRHRGYPATPFNRLEIRQTFLSGS